MTLIIIMIYNGHTNTNTDATTNRLTNTHLMIKWVVAPYPKTTVMKC